MKIGGKGMRVLLTEKVRALLQDRQGADELRHFIANANLSEPAEIEWKTSNGIERKFRAKLVPQG